MYFDPNNYQLNVIDQHFHVMNISSCEHFNVKLMSVS